MEINWKYTLMEMSWVVPVSSHFLTQFVTYYPPGWIMGKEGLPSFPINPRGGFGNPISLVLIS